MTMLGLNAVRQRRKNRVELINKTKNRYNMRKQLFSVMLCLGAVGGMENDTLNITYSLKMMVIGVILIYECYIIGQKKR